jgi:hypothetical protein
MKSAINNVFIGRCAVKGCSHVVRVTKEQIDANPEQWNGFRCEKHWQYPLRFRQIIGVVNPDHKCDSRCTHAKGFDCECACGGLNHGLQYAL